MSDQPNAAADTSALGPIREGERLANLDVLRGFAIFGILFVNMQFFALPLMEAVGQVPMNLNPAGEAAWAFVKIFCEYKFISLFSLLFGAGLIVQMTRAEVKGASFVPVYLRRLIVLALIGLAHALLLWYGDILFVYAWVGLIMLLGRNLKPKVLFIVAACLIGFSTLVPIGFGVLGLMSDSIQFGPEAGAGFAEVAADEVVAPAIAGDDGAILETSGETSGETDGETDDDAESPPLRGFAAMQSAMWNPANPIWLEAETAAYRDGPFREAIVFRGVSFAFAVMSAMFGYGWRVIAMFAIGAGLMKVGFFTARGANWQRKLMVWGLAIGLPFEMLSAGIQIANDHAFGVAFVIATPFHDLGSFALCLGYLGLVCRLTGAGVVPVWLRGFAAVGRLALTTYLLETVLTTALMYWWGFGWFGSVSRPGLIGLTLAIYAVITVLSLLWLTRFTMGPIEWLWRSLTYARPQPILRRRGA